MEAEEGSAADCRAISYTYWKRDLPDAHLVAPTSPQRIEDPKELQKAQSHPVSSWSAPSAWNKSAATWEERDISQRFNSDFGALLVQYLESEHAINLTEVNLNETKATVAIVRGTPRLGYETDFEFSMKLPHDPSTEVTVQINEFCDYDDSFLLKGDSSSLTPELRNQLTAALKQFRKVLPSKLLA